MKLLFASLLAFAMATAAHAQAPEPGPWRIVGAPGEDGYALVIGFKDPPNTGYLLRCAIGGVQATNIGATQITDRSTGKDIGDAPGSQITQAASVMGLMTGSAVAPAMRVAVARPNATYGWDLTIGIPFSDPALKTLGRAKFMSLMTLGAVQAVSLSPEDRKLFKTFLDACRNT